MLINILGIVLILAIIWWFWIAKKPLLVVNTAQSVIKIIVKNGVYEPARIKIPANTSVTLQFLRHDPSGCAEYVIFSNLNISKQLPLNQPVDVVLNISEPGEYVFSCQMNMYRGTLVVA
jgi:plastocyanin domain-containing protein